MRPDMVIGIKSRGRWKPAVAMLMEWRRKGFSPGLPTSLDFAEGNGEPSAIFRGLWRQALPLKRLPAKIIKADGTPTMELLDAWER